MSGERWVRAERLVLFLLTGVMATLFLIEWRQSRAVQLSITEAFKSRESSWMKWAESQMQKIRLVGRDLSKRMDRIAARNDAAARSQVSELPTDSVIVSGAEGEAPSEETSLEHMGPVEPPLPEKVRDPKIFVEHLNVPEFFADPDFNPKSVELSSSERVRAMTEAEIAKLQFKLLDKEILRICAENVDRMRAEGNYLDYARGQSPDPVEPGLVTYGETLPGGGMRVYHFFPEEFESIYERRERQQRIGELTIRRLLAFVHREG